MERFYNDVNKAYAMLDLSRKIVGVKLIKTSEEFEAIDAIQISRPISYCVAVKSATRGHSIKFNKDTSDCGGSTRALGLEEPSYDFFNGTEGCKLGLFKDKETAMTIASQTSNISTYTYGILVQPIEKYGDNIYPDVVLIISHPREMMRVMQGYTYHYGITKNISMSGNQGICVEATAYPLINNTINVSFLCSGTRFLANWSKNEVAIGMPFHMFSKVVDGIYHTINSVEMDDRKQEISKAFSAGNIADLEMEYGKTYYTEYEKEKREKRKNEKK